ncbi:MAG TPA: cofactor-independent phosphoglycerate mutase [Clostridiales bacterium]|nr:cofactor-independent phosphoglycerate mutase [Clostridiales bacterium]
MKFAVVLFDGMSDYPVPMFDGKTPMMLANKPNLDKMARYGVAGLVKTVPDGFKPGSDVANLGVLGYDVRTCYTGRSPLEAASIGIDLKDTDVTLRCNLVTLSEEAEYSEKTMIDYSAGDISSAEAAEIIKTVQEHFGNDVFTFYAGVSYRHCLVWNNGTIELGNMTPPHDIANRVIGEFLSTADMATELIRMMRESYELLKDHPVNVKRISEGKRPANSIWLWGEGTKPRLELFKDLYALDGSIISAVDLLRGIGKCAGMSAPEVEGATGYLDTNFTGKYQAAVDELKSGKDFVYIHVEAPDECGHRNEPENKVRAIELIDELILGPLIAELEKFDDYAIMALPDHPTPIVTQTHAPDPVPFAIYRKGDNNQGIDTLNEETAKQTGIFYESGRELFNRFIKK